MPHEVDVSDCGQAARRPPRYAADRGALKLAWRNALHRISRQLDDEKSAAAVTVVHEWPAFCLPGRRFDLGTRAAPAIQCCCRAQTRLWVAALPPSPRMNGGCLPAVGGFVAVAHVLIIVIAIGVGITVVIAHADVATSRSG